MHHTSKSDIHTFYNLDSHLVLEHLETTEEGLSTEEVIIRQNKYGKNLLQKKQKASFATSVLGQCKSPLIAILVFAALVTIYLGEVVEPIVIFLAVFINIGLGAYQEFKAENTIEQLQRLVTNTAFVLRHWVLKEINSEELVIGDIVALQYGSRVPADIRILNQNDLKIDETILTGESLPVEKTNTVVTEHSITERSNYAFAGTLVVSGNGLGVVTHIGGQTEIGSIASSLSLTKKVPTPVQHAVNTISWYIFAIALVIVAGVFLLGVSRGEPVLEMLVLSAAVAVGAVPESLPITLTVILALGVFAISKKGGLIRKLAAAETLGSTTLILTDKTGTLTEGNLELEHVITSSDLGSQMTQISTDFKSHTDANNKQQMTQISQLRLFKKEHLLHEEKELLLQAKENFSVVQTSSTKGNDEKARFTPEFSGNSFEVIIAKILALRGLWNTGSSKLVVPFNSTNKYSVSIKNNENNKEKTFTILGAPDKLLAASTFSHEQKQRLEALIQTLSESGKRLVAIAQKQANEEFVLEKIEFLGIFVFSDILREGIRDSVERIIKKGVQVKMITGDLPGTARAIGNMVGITALPHEVLTGMQMTDLSDEDLLAILSEIKIFARVTPEDKLRIGKLYQQLGEVVAMTGDGVNDAPSLKAMDIGISLSSGSEVAKSASDMILLDNNFNTIVETISVGHSIKSNIQKVFVYLMSTSLNEVFVISGSLIAGLALPLSALQIIWVNMLTGTLPAIAFAYDTHTDHGRTSKTIFDMRTKFLAFGIGTLSSFLMFFLYYIISRIIDSVLLAQSVFFLCFGLYVFVVSYSYVRFDKHLWHYNPFSNWRLNGSIAIGAVLVFLSVYTKIGQQVFDLVSVPASYLWIVVVWILFNVLLVEGAKFLFVKSKDLNLN